jgi:hypothetical protein
VVGGHRVTQLGQHARSGDVGDRSGRHTHALEVRRLADVGRVLVPGEGVALGGLQALPALVAGEDVGVVLLEQLAREDRADGGLDILGRGPDVLEEDVIAGLVLAERLGSKSKSIVPASA